MDDTGCPSFNALQNLAPNTRIVYYIFDLLILAGRNVMSEPLSIVWRALSRGINKSVAFTYCSFRYSA